MFPTLLSIHQLATLPTLHKMQEICYKDNIYIANSSYLLWNAFIGIFFCLQPIFFFFLQPLINGLLNVSTCKFDSPAYVSYPHFYLGDPLLVNQFAEGSLKPDPAKHESFISLEPRSGIPLEVAVRMQINSLIRPLSIPSKIDDSHYGFVNIE